MKLAPQKKLTEGDSTQGLIYILNNFMDFVFRAFNKNVTIEDNTPYQVFNLSFTTQATYSSGAWNELRLRVTPARQVLGVLLLQIVPTPASAQLSWTQEGQDVVITGISGLSDSISYTFRVLVL